MRNSIDNTYLETYHIDDQLRKVETLYEKGTDKPIWSKKCNCHKQVRNSDGEYEFEYQIYLYTEFHDKYNKTLTYNTPSNHRGGNMTGMWFLNSFIESYYPTNILGEHIMNSSTLILIYQNDNFNYKIKNFLDNPLKLSKAIYLL